MALSMTVAEYVDFGKRMMTECERVTSHEQASQHICQQLYHMLQQEDQPALALVRVYRLTRVEDLPPDLRALVDPDELFVMSLTGTYGLQDEWRRRQDSAGHKVVPVNKIAIPSLIPMFEQLLVRDMKADLPRLYETRNVIGSVRSTGGTFYIEDVPTSPVIPAQDTFVEPYGVKSLVGFGGLMAGSERLASLFVLVAFSRVHFTPEMADAFHRMHPFVGTALASRAAQPIFTPA